MRRLALLTGAWVLLAVAINLYGGFYSPRALVALVASYVALIAAVVVPAADPADDTAWGRFAVVLRGRSRRSPTGGGPAVAGAWCGGHRGGRRPVAIGTMGLRPGTDLAEVMAGSRRAQRSCRDGRGGGCRGRSRPGIGWWPRRSGSSPWPSSSRSSPTRHPTMTSGSPSRRLVHVHPGLDLYERCWPGNTDPLTDCVYAYLPLTSVLVAPGLWLLGDIRYAYILAMAIASLAVTRIAPPRIGVLFGFLMAASGFALVQRPDGAPASRGIAGACGGPARARPVLLLAMAVVFARSSTWSSCCRSPPAGPRCASAGRSSRSASRRSWPCRGSWPAPPRSLTTPCASTCAPSPAAICSSVYVLATRAGCPDPPADRATAHHRAHGARGAGALCACRGRRPVSPSAPPSFWPRSPW